MNPKQLPSGKWQLSFRDQDKKLRRQSFGRKKDADKFLDEIRCAVRNKTYIAPAKVPTVSEACKTWFEEKRVTESKHGGERKVSTLEYWRNHILTHIVPAMGTLKVDGINIELAEKIRDDLRNKPLSPVQVNKVLVTIRSIFNRQVGRSIHSNPFAQVNGLAVKQLLDEEDGVVSPSQVYSPENVKSLIDAADGLLEKTILQTLSFTGLRHGELLGLEWSHINFEKEEIFVGQSLSGIREDGAPIIEKPKTKTSRRFIPISSELVHQLRKWKLASPKSPWNLVFCQVDGKPLHRKSTWNIANAAMRKADLKIIRVHDLRHSFATIHLIHGTPAIELAGLLGHSSVDVTLRVYAHFDPAQRSRKSTDVFAAAVYGTEKSTEVASSK